jgi:oligosaccharyltransferase complex subunit alpha (ribophorin I)
MALRSWLRLPVLALAAFSSCIFVSASSHSFENTAIVRTVDLGGSLVSVTTTYAIRALADDAQTYVVSLGKKEAETVSWFEAKLKGQSNPLPIKLSLLDPHESVLDVAPSPNLLLTRLLSLIVALIRTPSTFRNP